MDMTVLFDAAATAVRLFAAPAVATWTSNYLANQHVGSGTAQESPLGPDFRMKKGDFLKIVSTDPKIDSLVFRMPQQVKLDDVVGLNAFRGGEYEFVLREGSFQQRGPDSEQPLVRGMTPKLRLTPFPADQLNYALMVNDADHFVRLSLEANRKMGETSLVDYDLQGATYHQVAVSGALGAVGKQLSIHSWAPVTLLGGLLAFCHWSISSGGDAKTVFFGTVMGALQACLGSSQPRLSAHQNAKPELPNLISGESVDNVNVNYEPTGKAWKRGLMFSALAEGAFQWWSKSALLKFLFTKQF